MKNEDLFDAFTNIDDELIKGADEFKFRNKKRSVIPLIISFAAAAAVFAGAFIAADNFIGNDDITPIDGNTVGNGNSDIINGENTLPSENETVTGENITSEKPGENLTETPNATDSVTEDSSSGTVENPHINKDSHSVSLSVLGMASYPEMSKYPNTLIQYGPIYDAMYDKWWADVKKQMSVEVDSGNITDFAFSLMEESFNDADGKNKVISPLNIYMALSVLAETVDGESRNQILGLLGVKNIEQCRSKANRIWNKNYRDDGYRKSILANSLWLNDSIMYKKSAVTSIVDNYYASVYSGTMGSSAFDKKLNNWIKEQTDGVISPSLSMSPDTVMAIASTLLYQTKWDDEFSPTATKNGTFHSPTGDKTARFMYMVRDRNYYWGEKFSAINLGLAIGGEMWFILPDEGVDVNTVFSDSELQSLLSGNAFSGYEKKKFLEVHITIPKFDIKTESEMKDDIMNLGVTDIFDSKKADFSPFATNPEGIFIDKINHGVRIKMDEEGVSAASYVIIEGAGSAAPPDDKVYFTLDRPFAFVITLDNSTPLFAGVVNNP